jgi:CelD/BcsL family acetyltransferase involved in cellulose biosynthesis
VDSSLQLGVTSEWSDLPLSGQVWNELIARAPTHTVFQSYEWLEAWWQNFGASHQLYFLWVRRDAQIVAFAPLMISVGSMGLRKLEFAGVGNADYLDFCYPTDQPELLSAMLGLLQARCADWDVLKLGNLPVHSATFQQLPAILRDQRMPMLHETTVLCPTLLLKDRVEQVRAMIDKYSVRRKVNWFDKHGDFKVLHLTDAEAIKSHLEGFFTQHTERWHRKDGCSQFERPGQREFFIRLVDSLTKCNVLVFTVVLLNGEAIAYHFGFDYRDRMIWYKPAFSARYAEHSPGLVLMRSLIEEAMRRGKDEFDYTVGGESFKYRFSNLVRANAYVSIYHGRSRYGIALGLHLMRGVARSAVRTLRDAWRAVGRRDTK